jgi:glycosyltransferase involved in cell wall biosynthesis
MPMPQTKPQATLPAPINRTQFNKDALGRKSSRAVRPAVLHLCPELDPNETARETVDLAILTQRSGRRALIVSAGGTLVTSAERAAVRHARMPIGETGWFTAWRNRVHLETIHQRERPVLVHAHGVEVLPHAYRYCAAHRVPLLIDITQPLTNPAAVKKLLGKMKAVTYRIRVPSQFMQHYLTTTLGIDEGLIDIVPPGIDMAWYNASSISSERLQKLSHLWRLPEQASVMLMPMPLAPDLGHKQFLEALREMRNDNIYAILVGHDDAAPGARAEIERMIVQLGLTGKVIMPDYCTDWPAAFWLSSTVIAANSAPRGQNKELLAAQSIGRAIIATDVGANAEMVRSGETAWLIARDDPKVLIETLREAVRLDTEQRLNIAANTRAFIDECFPQSRWFDGMTELYDSLIEESLPVRMRAA